MYVDRQLEQSEYSEEGVGGWIQWFCNLQDHQFFSQVDQEFVNDKFNLYGIKPKFNHYQQAINMILKPEQPDQQQLQDQRFLQIYQEATDIYGLIHARYILTPKGLAIMRQKYLSGKFGMCPRVLCDKQHALPIGLSQDIRTSRVKIFCPKCQDTYVPKKKYQDVDGAYFGCSFPQILLMTYQDLIPAPNQQVYVPRVYGFKIYKKKGSKYQQNDKQKQLTHYSQQQLKSLKNKFQGKKKVQYKKQ